MILILIYIVGIVVCSSFAYVAECKKYGKQVAEDEIIANTAIFLFWPLIVPIWAIVRGFYYSVLGLGTLIRIVL